LKVRFFPALALSGLENPNFQKVGQLEEAHPVVPIITRAVL